MGAVSYSLGSFPKEPLAGITPIEEMTSAVDAASTSPVNARRARDPLAGDIHRGVRRLGRLAARAAAPLGTPGADLRSSARSRSRISRRDCAPSVRRWS